VTTGNKGQLGQEERETNKY